MKKILLLNFTFLIFNSTLLFSQSPNWLWAKSMGGTGNDVGQSIATDASGNVYTTGRFQGTVDFDPGAGTFNLTSSGYDDIFISKLDIMGNFVWAKRIGGISGDEGRSITIDASGNVYTTGSFWGTVDFDPGVGTFNLTSAGGNDIFISKLDSSGNFVWAKRIGGTYSDVANSITIDASGNVYTTGGFSDTVDFDPGVGVFNLFSPGGGYMFISKLNNMGNFVWAKAIGGYPGYSIAFSIALDVSANVYTTGRFSMTVDFDPSAGVFNLTSAGTSDIFISKLDSTGNFVWAKSMRGTYDDYGASIVLDASGNVYTTGYFSLTADFDPDSLGTFNLTSAGGPDIFISKLDSSGNFIWAKRMGGTSFDYGKTIALDALGNIYMTGGFADTADFDPDSSATFNLTSVGNFDIFISKLDSSGNFVWAKAAGGTDWENVSSMALDVSGNLYFTGYFKGTSTTFGTTTLLNDSADTWDIFIAKLDNTITGIESVANNNNDISVFPNPTNNHLTISFPTINKKVEVAITDITGKIIYKTTATESQKIEVNTKDFEEGIYLVKIQSEGFFKTKKLIIAR